MDEFIKFCADAVDGALAEEGGKFLQSGNFERLLDLVDWIALGRGGDAETVPGEGRVALFVNGLGDVAVVEVVEGEIPVAAIETDAVGQDLEGLAGSVVWLAVGGGDGVLAADGFVLEMEKTLSTVLRVSRHVYVLVRWAKLTPVNMLSGKSVPGRVRERAKLVTSISDTGFGRLKTALRAEMEMGMFRFWHFLAMTAVTRARRTAGLNMVVV